MSAINGGYAPHPTAYYPPAPQGVAVAPPLQSTTPVVNTAQLLSDEEELKSARMRATSWAIPFGYFALLSRMIFQKPEDYARKREDVRSGRRRYEDALAHERKVKQAQIVAQIPLALLSVLLDVGSLMAAVSTTKGKFQRFLLEGVGIILGLVQLGAIALFNKPEAEVRKKYPNVTIA
jgi:hypothetical protein